MVYNADERLLKTAELIAELAHKGQIDESGVAYIEHPRTVASKVETIEEKIVAMLHDVLEDTDVTEEQLRPIFGDRITDALLLLTRDRRTPYFTYVRNLSKNPLSKVVKLADLSHNMDASRTCSMGNPAHVKFRNEKYRAAYRMLTEVL